MKTTLETLLKIAYDLDRRGKYSEADKIEDMIKSLQQRTGLVITEDMVALADELDLGNEVEAAELLDGIIEKLASKKNK